MYGCRLTNGQVGHQLYNWCERWGMTVRAMPAVVFAEPIFMKPEVIYINIYRDLLLFISVRVHESASGICQLYTPSA